MFCGARKKSRNVSNPELSCSIGINGFRRVTRFSRKLTPGGLKNIYNYVGFSHAFLEKWKMGSSECFVLLSFSWYPEALCRHFGPKGVPSPETFNFVQVFNGVWEGNLHEFVFQNHQYSLGFS